MKRYSLFLALAVVLTISLFTLPAFSQEEKTPAEKAPATSTPASAVTETAPAKAPAVTETVPAKMPEMPPAPAPAKETAPMKDLSIYGEVKSVNPSASSMTVQYYDYDSDEEKSIDIVTDKDSKLENVANVGEIKQGDWIDATYAAKDSQNIAKSIIVEKEEMPAETEKAPAGTAAGSAEE